MDKTYPFFDLKDIRKGWPALKKQLYAKVRRCTSDGEFLEIVLEAIKYLRDGHIYIAKTNAKLPPGEPRYYPGLGFMPATKNRVIVMSAPERLAELRSAPADRAP